MMSNYLRISKSKNGDSAAPEKSLRRSSRQTAATAEVKTREVSAESASTSSLSEPRRNPKRKAAEAARESINLPDNLLDEALRPLTPADIEEWEGWVELESEPVSSVPLCVTSQHQYGRRLIYSASLYIIQCADKF